MTGNILLIIMLAVALVLCALTVIATVNRPSERKGTRAYSVFGRGKGKASKTSGNEKVSAAEAKPEQPHHERRPYMTSAGNMNLKYKLKFRFGALIKSLICGVAFGLFVVGLLLIILKRSGIKLNPFIYVLIGLGSALVFWAVMFFILNPSYRRIARRIDNDHRLNERIQTALAFEEKDGAIVALQREDAGERLVTLPKLKPKFSRIWQYCLIVLIGVVISVTGIIIPAVNAEEPYIPPEDRPFELSRTQSIELQQLIQDVNSGGLPDELKTSTVQVLEKFFEDISAAKTMGSMQTLVNAVDKDVNDILEPVNSYQKIYTSLNTSSQRHLAQTVMRGVVIYKSTKLTSNNDIKLFWNERFDLVSDAINRPLSAFRSLFSDDSKLKDSLMSAVSGITYALETSKVDASDDLYSVLFNLKEQLREFAQTVPEDLEKNEDSESEWQQKLDDEIFVLGFVFYDKITYALQDQTYNFAMDKYIRNKIKIIFGFPVPEDDEPLPQYQWRDDDDGTTHDPSIPDTPPFVDTPVIGNDDGIYDPVTGSYKTLEELYEEYYGHMLEWLTEAQLSEEQVAIVTAYFENMKEKEESGNN